MRINCHSQIKNKVYYNKSSLLLSIERDKKPLITYRESTIRKNCNSCGMQDHATAP